MIVCSRLLNRMTVESPGVRFAGLAKELSRFVQQSENETAMSEMQQLHEKRVIALNRNFQAANGQVINGFQVLQLIQELTVGNRMGLKQNAARLGYLGLGTFWVGTFGLGALFTSMVVDCWTHYRSDYPFKRFVEVFRNGPRQEVLERLIGTRERATDVLYHLRQLDLIRDIDGAEYGVHIYSLTEEGRRYLKNWNKGKIGNAAALKSGGNGAPSKETPVRMKVRTDGAKRQEMIHALLAEQDGVTGWQVLTILQRLQKDSVGLLSWVSGGWEDRQVLARTLRLGISGQMSLEQIHPRLQQLQRLGLLSNTIPDNNADQTKWQLSMQARELLSTTDPLQAMAVTLLDLEKILQDGLHQIETDKAEREEAIAALAKQGEKLEDEVSSSLAGFSAAKSRVLTLDAERNRQDLSDEARQALIKDLSAAVFQVRILEEQVKFHRAKVQELETRIQGAKARFGKWHRQAVEKAVRLNRSLWEIKQAQEAAVTRRVLSGEAGRDAGVPADMAQVAAVFSLLSTPMADDPESADVNQAARDLVEGLDLEAQVSAIRAESQVERLKEESLKVEFSGPLVTGQSVSDFR